MSDEVSKGSDEARVYYYGYKVLDEITGGLHPGELILIGARPGMGKSKFIKNVISRWIDNYKIAPHIIITESNKRKYWLELLYICIEHLDAMAECSEKSVTGISFSDFLSDIAEIIRKRENKLLPLIYDQMRLVYYDTEANESYSVKYGDTFKLLKEIAEKCSIPVIVLMVWPRICEEGNIYTKPPKPSEEDLLFTDVSKDDFDTIMLLYRDNYYYWDTDNPPVFPVEPDTMEINVVKSLCRCGEKVNLRYDSTTGYISETN